MISTDYLVIGSGIAGLTFALKTARHDPNASVLIITKSDESESNTKYAQGGVAVALDNKFDSFEKHIHDTLVAGDGLCDRDVVELVVREGVSRLNELVEWGASFDKLNQEYHLGKEGGHTANRIVHHRDSTGLEIEKTLLMQIHRTPNITVLSHYFAIDIITEHHTDAGLQPPTQTPTCFGAYVLNLHSKKIDKVLSRITLLATGGVGQVYKNTTNPIIDTGDGIAMAYRAGADIRNMEFVQFHPTALYVPNESPSFLISEAVRGFGAILRTQDGCEFMHTYDQRKELASRDIVARAIDHELKKRGEEFVYLDCRHLDINDFISQFPNIYLKCKDIGIDVATDLIPVVPAAHYLCGGISVDTNGRTSINNLYACGECSYTGLHGANRLASNSLLEAVVFAHRCYESATNRISQTTVQTAIPDWNAEGTLDPSEQILITQTRKELQELMGSYVGIVRTSERLKRAMERIRIIQKETKNLYDRSILSPQLCELRNLVAVAYLIVKQSMQRKTNKGVFYRAE